MNSENVSLFDQIQDDLRDLLSRDFYVLGEETKHFEQEFAEYMGVKHCITVSSGTSALVLLLRACNLPQGSKVLVPAFTPIPTSMAIFEAGLIPEFVDVDRKSLTLDLDNLERHIDPDVKAIIPVHIFGKLCALDNINQFAKTHNLKIVEDACQAVGSRHPNYSIAQFSVGAGMSFYPTKNLGCWGDGGAILTNSNKLAEQFIEMRHYGFDSNFESKSRGANYRMDELQALVLRKKLAKLESHNISRRNLANKWKRLLGEKGFQYLAEDEEHNYHVISYLCENPYKKEAIRKIFKEVGIRYRFFYDYPVQAFGGLNLKPKFHLENCEWIAQRVINLYESQECFEAVSKVLKD
tara:strand:- start:1258 stop:2313 length:1056 start_codon:yes stop_codon:yes gene_type:complete